MRAPSLPFPPPPVPWTWLSSGEAPLSVYARCRLIGTHPCQPATLSCSLCNHSAVLYCTAWLLQVRALSGTAYRSDEDKFVEMARASLALGRAYIDLANGGVKKVAGSSNPQPTASAPPGSSTATPSSETSASSQQQQGASASSATPAFTPAAARELAAARMHLRGVIKQCESAFEEHELYKQLQALLDEVAALESAAQSAAGRS
jgi:hypothetical protein